MNRLPLLCLHTDNAPNIERCAQREYERCEKDRGRGEFKLPVLAVVHIRESHFCEEKDREDKVDDREHDVVDDALDLRLCRVPSVLDRTGNVAGCGKCRDGKGADKHHDRHDGKPKFCLSFTAIRIFTPEST